MVSIKNAKIIEIFLQVAGFIIKIEFLQHNVDGNIMLDELQRRKEFINYFEKIYKNFIFYGSSSIDFEITVESKESIFTRTAKNNSVSMLLFESISDQKIRTFYHISLYQFQLILRDIVFKLVIKNNGLVIHASAIVIRSKAYLFLGKSTAGKSTVVRLLRDFSTPIADDIAIVMRRKEKYFVYTTPFIEKQRWLKKQNKKYILSGIFFIKKGKKSYMKGIIDESEILDLLLNQILIVKENKHEIIQLCLGLISGGITFSSLTFRKNREDLKQIISSLKT